MRKLQDSEAEKAPVAHGLTQMTRKKTAKWHALESMTNPKANSIKRIFCIKNTFKALTQGQNWYFSKTIKHSLEIPRPNTQMRYIGKGARMRRIKRKNDISEQS